MNNLTLNIIKWTSLLLIAVAVLIIMRTVSEPLIEPLKAWIEDLNVLGPIVFGIIYIIATIAFVPGLILTIAAGALFGLVRGTIVVSISSVIGASLAFLIARYLARKRVEAKAKESGKFAAIDEAIDEGGWKIVAMLRLSPAVPFNLQNYLYGLTSIKFWQYVLTSWIAMLPGTFMYVYIGYIGQQAATEDTAKTGQLVLTIIGFVATALVTVYITFLAKKKLDEQTAIQETENESNDSMPEENKKKTSSPVGTFVTAGIAAILVGTAAYAHFNADTIKQKIDTLISSVAGPPAVTLEEEYASDQDGESGDATAVFNHSAFDELLQTHVDDDGWIDYEGFAQDSEQLGRYITSIAEANFDDLSRDGKLTFLINAYNAFTIQLILDHWDGGKLESIKDIPSSERWLAERWNIAGNIYSLEQIEHEEIRPKFIEPRIHFALVCAAVGCPPLRNEAFTATDLEQQLEEQTQYVHSHDTWLRYDSDSNTAHLTALYDWYGNDFVQVAGSVLEYVAQYSEPLQDALRQDQSPSTEFLDYDWSLNSIDNKIAR